MQLPFFQIFCLFGYWELIFMVFSVHVLFYFISYYIQNVYFKSEIFPFIARFLPIKFWKLEIIRNKWQFLLSYFIKGFYIASIRTGHTNGQSLFQFFICYHPHYIFFNSFFLSFFFSFLLFFQ